ncbi:MAG: LuxR family transcriptional regulator [Chloroflexi bacterium]|jgi:DNA-binding NarL/FixJ family response regulator|nr:LuxR family transcriptional regulator [Chloroflexota bacterium]
MEPITVLLVDDHPIVRDGLHRVLETQPDMQVVGEAGDGEQAIAKVREHAPRVVVMDVQMPKLDGIRATRQIHKHFPRTQVLILSAYDTDRYVFGLLEAGATGYVLKEAADEEVLAAIRAAARGEPYLTPRLRGRANPVEQPLDALTGRETAVLCLMAEGLDNAEIAERLVVSKVTVQNHTSAIYSKLGVSTRAKAILYAIQRGLVEPSA